MGANKGNKDLEDTLNKAINNALNKETFVFYPSFYESVKMIKDEKTQHRVLCSIIEYGCYGKPIDVSDIDPQGFLSMAIGIVKNDMDMAKDKRDKISKLRSEAGKRGGGQKGNQNARKNNRTESEENDADDADDADDEDDVGGGKNEQDDETNKTDKTSKNQQNEPYVDVDVDGDVDVDDKKNISCDISEKAEPKTDEVEIIQPPKRQTVDHKRVVDMWNDICTSNSKVMKLTPKRKQKITARMKELGYDYEAIRTVFEKVDHSEFMKGEPWATFDWVMGSEDRIVRIQENQLQHKSRPKSFSEANNNVNAIWEERERKAEQRRLQYHPNEYWENFEFNPSDFQ